MLGPNWYWAWSGAPARTAAAASSPAITSEGRGRGGRAHPAPPDSTPAAGRSDGRLTRSPLLGEQDAAGLDFFLGEDVDDAVLERQQVLEHAGQGIGLLPLEILEILEVVLIEQGPGLAIVDLHQDVVLEAGLLDQDLPVVGLAVEGRGVFLGAVAAAVLDVEIDAAAQHQVGVGAVADRAPEVGLLGELGEVVDREVDRPGLDHLELGLAPQHL